MCAAPQISSAKSFLRLFVLAVAWVVLGNSSVRAADLEAARQQFITGQYGACVSSCEKAIAEFEYEEEWRTLMVNSLVATGGYERAGQVLSNALDRYTWSIPLRLLAIEVLPFTGEADRKSEFLRQIETIVSVRSDSRFRDAASVVAFGKAALMLGADPRRVLDNVFEQAKRQAPNAREVYLAMGELALDKRDYDLASKHFSAGLKKFADDPDMHFGLARAFQSGNRKKMLEHATAALDGNTNHVGAMLLIVEHLIAAEEYKEAESLLDRAHKVNRWHPQAWGYRAVLAHLRNDADAEKKARANALKFWKTNPAVDHLIGLNLSQKYRFAEGAEYQRRALKFDAEFTPAKAQLAQDLLRLGEEDEGWKLAEQAHEHDEYDVTSYNLVTLRNKMTSFATLTNGDFIVRMGTNEAPIYGEEVLALLSRAKSNVVARYGARLDRPTIIEIYPEQKDFGVRTFGIPDNPGFLGVCFGPVVTANSPASQTASPANWQAVLWHEFTHVVTLAMTKNKMPRWLSEGISVFEELEANPAWGQRLNARYREMLLGDDFTPIGELSSAFLAPKTPLHLQFAYYQSSLAVEFLVKNWGFDAVKAILRDLGEGTEINKAIVAHTVALEELEKRYAAFAKGRAESLAPSVDFTKPEPRDLRSPEWLEANATNYYALQRRGIDAINKRAWSNAIPPLEKLTQLYTNASGEDSPWTLLARVHRAMNNTNAERAALEKVTAMNGDALESFNRLAELAAQAEDWPVVYTNAHRALAVNPLIPQPHRHLAQAAEALGRDNEAIRASRILLLLDPPDPAQTHFRLARLLHKQKSADAKRHVLMALEEAPRFRDAHRLLREIRRAETTPTAQLQ
jgi:tetratricopeptide (TPR) repeat protein